MISTRNEGDLKQLRTASRLYSIFKKKKVYMASNMCFFVFLVEWTVVVALREAAAVAQKRRKAIRAEWE